ncbi:hypothetical protein L1049_007444 [Liquidambar formosana]|uniref:DUF4218 domain-containing protein n=1 Tax=Liquidambar formosana TaxID=63359 RepID=A0AAP0N5T2_LIQFO
MGIRKELHPMHRCDKYILPPVCYTLTTDEKWNLCQFLKDVKVEDLERLDHQIPKILCKLEQVFPLSFFNVMMHLSIHLAYEVKVASPVHYRWMYPVERSLRTYKRYVCNRAHVEGSIAEANISEECMMFFSWYLDDMDTKLNRLESDAAENTWLRLVHQINQQAFTNLLIVAEQC